MKVYLAGPINGCSDVEANGWRDAARRLLNGFHCVDPMARDYRGRESSVDPALIVDGDISDIRDCEIVLVNAQRPSWGTAMEVVYAHNFGLAVVVVVSNTSAVSPWLRFHATHVTDSMESAAEWIRGWS